MSGYSKTTLRKGTVKVRKAPGGYSPCRESVSGLEESMLLEESSRGQESKTDAPKGQSV
ncbi:MAG: hypothetical protein WCD79_00810 [Chthoniobacteraceae bacterium]